MKRCLQNTDLQKKSLELQYASFTSSWPYPARLNRLYSLRFCALNFTSCLSNLPILGCCSVWLDICHQIQCLIDCSSVEVFERWLLNLHMRTPCCLLELCQNSLHHYKFGVAAMLIFCIIQNYQCILLRYGLYININAYQDMVCKAIFSFFM